MPLCLIDQSCAVIHGLCARGRGEGEEIYLLLLAFIKNQNYWNIHITSKAVCTIIYYRCKTKHETTRPLQCTMEVFNIELNRAIPITNQAIYCPDPEHDLMVEGSSLHQSTLKWEE